MTKRNGFGVVLFALVGMSAGAVQAASGTWTNALTGTYNWNDGANWSGGIVASGTDALATFNVTPGNNQIINFDTAVTLGGLSLEWSNRYLTLQGANTLTLDVSSGTPVINVASGLTLTISSVIAGNDGFQQSGAGTLTLSGVNTYTGGTVLTGGILGVTSANSITAFAANDFAISGGARVNVRGVTTAQNVTIGAGGGIFGNGGNNNYITTGILSGSGTLTNIDVGGSSARLLSFNSTANTFTGGIIIQGLAAQTVQLNSLADSANNIAFTRLNTSLIGAGTFRYGSGAITGLTLDSRAFEINSSDLVNNIVATIENANTTNAITINTDLIATGAGAKTLRLDGVAGPTNIFAGDIVDETDGGDGTVALTKAGNSTWVLSGENTYSGITTVGAGTLALRGDWSLPHAGTLNLTNGFINIEGRAKVAALQSVGIAFPPGIYGSTASGAQFSGANLTRVDASTVANFFTGTGALYVGTPFPASGTVIIIE